jgi:hypothetical protein
MLRWECKVCRVERGYGVLSTVDYIIPSISKTITDAPDAKTQEPEVITPTFAFLFVRG